MDTVRVLSTRGQAVSPALNAKMALRWLIRLASLIVAYDAFDYSAASNLRRANPEAAYRLRPTDPAAIAAALNNRMTIQNKIVLNENDITNTRIGLGKDPLNPVLFRTLGVYGEITGDTNRAVDAMLMADRLSRRDSITQMWLAEYMRRQDDVSRSVMHYSAAMQVTPELQRVLFPQMVPQLADEKFRAAVMPYISKGVGWTRPFVATAAAQDAQATVYLISPILHTMLGKGYDEAFAEVVYQKMAQGEHSQARRFASAAFPGISSSAFDQIGWSKAARDHRLGKLAWAFEQSGGVTSTLDDKGKLSVDVSPLTREVIARRAIPVEGGKTYRLRYGFASAPESAGATLEWDISCLRLKGRHVFWESTPIPIRGAADVSQSFKAPSDCHLVQLDIIVTGADSMVPTTFTLFGVGLLPQ